MYGELSETQATVMPEADTHLQKQLIEIACVLTLRRDKLSKLNEAHQCVGSRCPDVKIVNIFRIVVSYSTARPAKKVLIHVKVHSICICRMYSTVLLHYGSICTA